MGMLILDQNLGADMKNWLKILTSKQFLDYIRIENEPIMLRESRPHGRLLFWKTFQWICTQY